MRILGTCAVALFSLAPMGALAAPIDPLALMRGTSVIALGDLTTESSADGANHLEGPAYIGGDLISVPGSYAANQDGLASITVGSATGTLIIGGSTSADIDGAQRGDVVLGGSHTGSAGTATVHDNVDGIPVAEMTRVFQDLSGNLAGLDTTVGAALDLSNPWNPLFTSGAGDDSIAVLNLTQAEMLALFENPGATGDIGFALDTGISLIINVAGTEIDADIRMNTVDDAVASRVLFNFYEANTIDFVTPWGNFGASVLAPFAEVTTPQGGAFGTFVVGSMIQKGELRPYDDQQTGYAGALPDFPDDTPAVPLPAGLLLLGSAFALAGLRRRG